MIIYKFYNYLYENKKKLNKLIIILCGIHSIYFIIQSLKENSNIESNMIYKCWFYYVAYIILAKIFYELIGKFWIVKYLAHLTKIYQKEVMPKNIKFVGRRRGFKDTVQTGFASNFVWVSRNQIKEEIEKIKPFLYRFDLKMVDAYLEIHSEIFNVSSKKEKQNNFMDALIDNDLFLKKKYIDEESKILNDFKDTKSHLRTSTSAFIISDTVSFKHIISILYDYFYMKWRLNIDIWVIANQPMLQYYDYKKKKYVPARIYSPDLKATKQRTIKLKDPDTKQTSQYIALNYMLSEDWICWCETEADIWWSNITSEAKEVLVDKGIRWFEVAQGHIMGEHTFSLRNGQVASRTQKMQRDIEDSFGQVTRHVEVYGGLKRNFFIKLFMFVAFIPLKFFPSFKAKCIQTINKNKMSGYIKIEIVFSRSEMINLQAPGISLTRLLNKEEPLYLNQYQTTICFRIRDCWGKYNTHYLEYLASNLTKNGEYGLLDIPSWKEDLKLHKDEILEMNYETSDIFGINAEIVAKESGKYAKVESNKKSEGITSD